MGRQGDEREKVFPCKTWMEKFTLGILNECSFLLFKGGVRAYISNQEDTYIVQAVVKLEFADASQD